jgi:hypothetical protein
MLAVGLGARGLFGFALRNLFLEIVAGLAPGSLKRVVAGLGMDVGSWYGQMHAYREGGAAIARTVHYDNCQVD